MIAFLHSAEFGGWRTVARKLPQWIFQNPSSYARRGNLSTGGRGGRAPFVRGAGVMRYVLELRALRAVSAESCAQCAGGREVCAVCAVGAMMCCRCDDVL